MLYKRNPELEKRDQEIYEAYMRGMSAKKLSEKYYLSPLTIYGIVRYRMPLRKELQKRLED